jgi:demethylmenaquinone methyltransferase/2-methoxy-6-polyprenyl-1,4-benzoquinol methylase
LIQLVQADSEQLPFDNNSFDAITVAFGVRNFEHLSLGLKEMHRVLKPGGICLILEFSQPQSFPVKQFYKFYSKYILPFAGQLLSNQRSAYEYLPESVNAFPFGEQFLKIYNEAGFQSTKFISLTFGIASIYEGRK